jgi:hypothetical protein
MLALTLLYAFAPDLEKPTSDQANGLSRSAVGFAGLVELLNNSGIATRIDRDDKALTQPSLTILTPPALMTSRELLAYPVDSPVLIVLDKWVAAPIPANTAWVERIAAYPAQMMQAQIAAMNRKITLVRAKGDFHNLATEAAPVARPHLTALPIGHIEQVQTLKGVPALLAINKQGLLVHAANWNRRTPPAARYPIYVLADPDLINNRGLADPVNAAAAVAIVRALRAGNGPIAVDVTLNGLGKSPSLLRAVFAPPFLGATICALLAALLMGLHAAIRFGPAALVPRIFARGKLALANNSAALVKMMGREAAMAPRYVAAARTLVLEQLGARRLAPAQQQALLDTLQRDGEGFDQLAAEAAGARTGGDLLAVARKTFAWRRRITSGHQ